MASYFLLPIFTTFLCSIASLIEGRNTVFHREGFTLDLIHRDSPLSPLYNPSLARVDVIANAYRRSISRAYSRKNNIASSSDNDIESPISLSPGEYIMKISIGTPPVETLGVADTGSDLTWTQCSPCTDCYKQDAPIFNPNKSSSYKTLSCKSKACSALRDSGSSCSNQSTCGYTMSYGDNSQTKGDLSSETLTFGSSSGKPVSIPKVAFGCGHDNTGNFRKETSGIIGLGGGPLSIVRQLNDTVNGKFSYCLVPIFKGANVTSKIKFGSHAQVSGSGVVSTPLVRKDPDTYYYLSLEGIRVGHKSLDFETFFNSKTEVAGHRRRRSAKGIDMIIDSGTTLTMLPETLYNALEGELKSAIEAETTPDPQGLFGLCYEAAAVANVTIPIVTVSFKGADLELPPSSTFLELEEEIGLVCLAMIPANDLAIFGNLSQENFLVGYDLVSNTVSFKPTDCTQQQ